MTTQQLMINVVPYIIIIGVFYFLLIRPQKKKEKQIQTMRSSIKEGDEISTIGGIYGKVLSTKDDIVTIEVGADKVKLKIARWAIGKVIESNK